MHVADRIAGAVDDVGISHFVTFLENTESCRRDLRRAENEGHGFARKGNADFRFCALVKFVEQVLPKQAVRWPGVSAGAP